MYDHTKQYRCTIIRGKSKKEMDDLLPAYAMVIDEICPCHTEDFDTLFNNAFQRFLPESDRIKKTLDNHRTEISGKLFGMYYRAEDGMVYESQRTMKYLEDNAQPAFFKDVCFKMQFPNGMDSMHTLQERVSAEINVRPNAFVLRILQLAQTAKQTITIKDIGYYILWPPCKVFVLHIYNITLHRLHLAYTNCPFLKISESRPLLSLVAPNSKKHYLSCNIFEEAYVRKILVNISQALF